MPGARLEAKELIALRALARNDRQSEVGRTNLPGSFRAKTRGQGQEVIDIRPYVAGDDVRAIDRNATARRGQLHVKIHQVDRDRSVLLVVDFRPSMLWGVRRAFRSVAAAEILTVLGWRASEKGARVGAVALTASGLMAEPPRAGHRAMLASIGLLVNAHRDALVQAGSDLSDPPLDEALIAMRRIMPRNAEVFLASGLDATGEGLDGILEEIKNRGVLRLLEIGDGTNTGLPKGAYRMVTQGGQVVSAELGEEAIERSQIDPANPPLLALQGIEATQ